MTWARRHAPIVVVSGLAAAWRFLQIRGLAFPPWVDSVHHTLLVRLLLERGGIPDTWAPYLPGVPFYYHFGFHVTAAVLARALGLEGLRLGTAVLLAGQLWQVVVVVGMYLVGLGLWRSRGRALTVAMLVGFVSQMPAFYLSWGRYSLLAGVAVLSFSMAAVLFHRPLATALLIAALGVTHYYAFVLGVLFAAWAIATTPGVRPRLRTGLSVAAGSVLVSPWLLRVWLQARSLSRAPGRLSPGAPALQPATWELLGPTRNHVLLVLAVCGLIALTLRAFRGREAQDDAARTVALWSATLALLLGPWHFGPFRPDHAAIVAFIPITLGATEMLWTFGGGRWAGPATLALVAWGLVETQAVVRPDTILGTRADRTAIEWVAGHTAASAIFLVDVKPWMAEWRGADGGWWIMPLTGRRTVLPPLAYTWGPPETTDLIRATAGRVDALQSSPDEAYCDGLEQLMIETGATYYYTRSPRPFHCPSLTTEFSASPVHVFGLGSSAGSPASAARPSLAVSSPTW